jgi:uncharacterized membrane protein (UPF0127 family)
MPNVAMRLLCIALSIAAGCLIPSALRASDPWAVAVFPSGAQFSLEIANDESSRGRGYMYREQISENEGMLFVFEKTGTHPFWMKNCKVALDIIWLDEDFRVVEIAHDSPPCPPDSDCPSIRPMGVARYVLEVAAGVARREGLSRGDRLSVLAEPAIP